MFSRIRIHIAILLSLALIFTGLGLAMARATTGPSGQLVLCAGSGPVVVYLDKNGKPAGPPHLCPDFALHVIGDAMLPSPVAVPARLRGRAPEPISDPVSATRLILRANARAPPVLA